jgi:preprotein translocase subunit YajC
MRFINEGGLIMYTYYPVVKLAIVVLIAVVVYFLIQKIKTRKKEDHEQ